MSEEVRLYLPWLLSAITICMILLRDDKHWLACGVGLCGQFLWGVWILASGDIGFVLMSLALWLFYVRNQWRTA
jgi:hypothetical protein